MSGKIMPVDELIACVKKICLANQVEHLSLFGSFATGTAGERSDIDFIVYGCKDTEKLEEQIQQIDTLRKIDLFFYDEVCSDFLRKDMDRCGQPIY